MKKNKIITSVLAGALLVGGAALGTSALFHDEEVSVNKLTLKTGTLDISVYEKEWVKNPVDINNDGKYDSRDRIYTNENNKEKSLTGFENIQPGDVFVRYIGVDNLKSTYDAKIEIKENETVTDDLGKYITVDSSNFVNGVNEGTDKQGKLPKGANMGGYIVVKVVDNEESSKALNGGKTIDIQKTYTVSATQLNK